MVSKNAPSKRNTKIIEKALESSPSTSKNLIVYHYNFNKRDYEIHNPLNFQLSSKLPMNKIKLVRRDIKTNVKSFPRPRFERQYFCKLQTSLTRQKSNLVRLDYILRIGLCNSFDRDLSDPDFKHQGRRCGQKLAKNPAYHELHYLDTVECSGQCLDVPP